MEPRIRAIDWALKLNLDVDGNPKPIQKRPIRVNTTFPSVELQTNINNNLNLSISDINLNAEIVSNTTPSYKLNLNQKGKLKYF